MTPSDKSISWRAAALGLAALALAGCGGSGGSPAAGPSAAAPAGRVLPVSTDPISNRATASTLHLDKVLVENNVDAQGRAVADHLEVTLSDSGSTPLSGVEFFYTFTDVKTGAKESYYAKMPASFTVPPGGTQTVNFTNAGGVNTVPVNQYSLYATSRNPLKVTVEASATGAAVVTTTVDKAPAGPETGN